jgi:hypothetical protein
MGLEQLLRKGLGIQEDAQPSSSDPRKEWNKECAEYAIKSQREYVDRKSSMGEFGLTSLIGANTPQPTLVGTSARTAGKSRTLCNIKTLEEDGEIVDIGIQFCLENEFELRSSVDGYNKLILPNSRVVSVCDEFEQVTMVVTKVGYINTDRREGEVLFAEGYGWFWADEFKVV